MHFNFTANCCNLIGYLFFSECQRLLRCSQNLLLDFFAKYIRCFLFSFVGGTLSIGIKFVVSQKWNQQFESFCQSPFPFCFIGQGVIIGLFYSDNNRMLIINSKLLLQLERVNLSAAQTLRAAFIKVRRNLHWKMVEKSKLCMMKLKGQLSCFLVFLFKTSSLIQ